MAEPDVSNVIIPGIVHVYTAPYGDVTLPVAADFDTDPVDFGFIEVGHTEDKGLGFNYKADHFRAKSHQSLIDIIDRITGVEVSFDVPLLETMSTDALILAFGGGSVTRTGGVGCYSPPAAGDRQDISAVIDLIDGDVKMRWCIAKVSIGGDIKTTFARGALPVIPVNLGVFGDETFKFYSKAAGLVTSSPVASIAITPLTKTLAADATWQLVATATLADSTTEVVTIPATWSSTDPTKATVSSTGLVTAVASGSASISCAYRGVTSTAPCVVTVS